MLILGFVWQQQAFAQQIVTDIPIQFKGARRIHTLHTNAPDGSQVFFFMDKKEIRTLQLASTNKITAQLQKINRYPLNASSWVRSLGIQQSASGYSTYWHIYNGKDQHLVRYRWGYTYDSIRDIEISLQSKKEILFEGIEAQENFYFLTAHQDSSNTIFLYRATDEDTLQHITIRLEGIQNLPALLKKEKVFFPKKFSGYADINASIQVSSLHADQLALAINVYNELHLYKINFPQKTVEHQTYPHAIDQTYAFRLRNEKLYEVNMQGGIILTTHSLTSQTVGGKLSLSLDSTSAAIIEYERKAYRELPILNPMISAERQYVSLQILPASADRIFISVAGIQKARGLKKTSFMGKSYFLADRSQHHSLNVLYNEKEDKIYKPLKIRKYPMFALQSYSASQGLRFGTVLYQKDNAILIGYYDRLLHRYRVMSFVP